MAEETIAEGLLFRLDERRATELSLIAHTPAEVMRWVERVLRQALDESILEREYEARLAREARERREPMLPRGTTRCSNCGRVAYLKSELCASCIGRRSS